MKPRARASYGLDAPHFLAIPVALIAFNVANGIWSGRRMPFVGAAVVAAMVAVGLHSSSLGKFRAWADVLDGLRLRGDERILDVGCGRGAVLILAARRLNGGGRAIGIDLWQRRDQSGNAPGATMSNAEAEGVADRVAVCTGDMTALPLADACMDVVVSNIAVHNVWGKAARDRALRESVRVLRPGGRLLIADLLFTRRYAETLKTLGMADITRRNLGWRMWWTGPWRPTHLVRATRPAV